MLFRLVREFYWSCLPTRRVPCSTNPSVNWYVGPPYIFVLLSFSKGLGFSITMIICKLSDFRIVLDVWCPWLYLQVPNYYKIITRPIDFSKIRSKLQRQNFNHYNTVEEFLADCKLVFKNCFTYNSVCI